MANLPSLPVELLETISSHLPQASLSSLSKTCHALHNILQPLLFSNIHLKWDSAAPNLPPIHTLLHTLLATPSLARKVKSVNIEAANFDFRPKRNFWTDEVPLPASRREGEGEADAKEEEVFRRAVEGLGLARPEKWMNALSEKSPQAMIALLVLMCPNLRALSVDLIFLINNPRFLEALQAIIDPRSPTSLQKLESVNITCPSSSARHTYIHRSLLPSPTFLHLFYLPLLANLSISAFAADSTQAWKSHRHEGISWPFNHPPDLSNLQSLKLKHTPAFAATLREILRHATRLRELEFDSHLPSSRSPLDLEDLKSGLLCIKGTLEALKLRYDIFADEALDVESLASITHGSLDDILATFPRLSSLKIPLAILMGLHPGHCPTTLANLLPRRLKELVLTDDLFGYNSCYWDGRSIIAYMEDFFGREEGRGDAEWKSATPALKRFMLDMAGPRGLDDDYFDGMPENRAALEEVCRAEGVECAVKFQQDEGRED